jgi:putative phage-type endonuclease
MAITREEWLASRRNGIGASEAAAVLGLSPWSSPAEIRSRKKGLIPEQEDSLRLKVGRLLEEPVAQLYAEREGVDLIPCGYDDTRFHPEGFRVFATPDRFIVGRDRGLECKTVDPRMAHHWGEDGSDGVPLFYVPQPIINMAVFNKAEWDLAALVGFDDFRVYRFRRDLDLEKQVVSQCDEFYRRYVLGDEELPLDGSEGCAEYLVKRYPANTLPMLGADAEAEELLRKLFAIRDQVKSDGLIETELENRLKAIIGEAEGIQGICGRITWRRAKDSKKVDWEAIARALGASEDLIEEHTNTVPGSRSFRPTPAKQ